MRISLTLIRSVGSEYGCRGGTHVCGHTPALYPLTFLSRSSHYYQNHYFLILLDIACMICDSAFSTLPIVAHEIAEGKTSIPKSLTSAFITASMSVITSAIKKRANFDIRYVAFCRAFLLWNM